MARRSPSRARGGKVTPTPKPPPVGGKKGSSGFSSTSWTVIAVGLAAALAAGLILVSVLGSGDDEPAAVTPAGTVEGAGEVEEMLAGIPQDGLAIGEPDAPVTLVEFADLQCPFCAQWAGDAFPVLVDEYVRDGRLRIEFRPMVFIGEDSERGARAALAAGEEGRLWHVLELLYRAQGPENSGWLSDALLEAVAASVDGLDAEALVSAASGDDALDERITEAGAEASANGINSTPSFMLGRTGDELRPVEVDSLGPEGLRDEIDALLGR
jgi:protein-disulfide isomerase